MEIPIKFTEIKYTSKIPVEYVSHALVFILVTLNDLNIRVIFINARTTIYMSI